MKKYIFHKNLIFLIFIINNILQNALSRPSVDDILKVNISIDNKQCNPMNITINNEKTQFIIINNSDRRAEWEILKEVMVIAERENIAPGFIQKITVKLEPGEYTMTCGLINNPKGKLIVTNKFKNIEKEKQKYLNYNLSIPIKEYKLYVLEEINKLIQSTQNFVLAIEKNNVNLAKSLFAPTRQHYERIEVITELFSDIDHRIDGQEYEYEKEYYDPNFFGFHKIEKALFLYDTTVGMQKYANILLKDILELQQKIKNMSFPVDKVINGAALLIEEIAANKISGEEDRYSKTDLWDLSANIEGSKKIIDCFRTILSNINNVLLFKLDNNFKKAEKTLNKYKINHQYKSYDSLNDKDRIYLKGIINTLAEDLSLVYATLM